MLASSNPASSAANTRTGSSVGTQRNVYLYVDTLPEDSGLEEAEQTRFYAMQEDLNYLIEHLK